MMSFVHTVDFSVTALHADCFGRARPSALLRFAQDAAESHCLLLGTDWDTMAGKGLFWAVIRQRLEITRLPKTGEAVTVKTWPMPTTRVAYPRATEGYDANGNLLFRLISLWVIVDAASRAMVLPGKSGVNVEGITLGCELKAPAGLGSADFTAESLRTVGFTELDVNGHMNNTRYLDWLCDLRPASFHKDHPVKAVTICYNNEAKDGQEIRLLYTGAETLRVDGSVTDTSVSPGHARIFSAEMEF
jgi:acyl-ACP thioesterase